MNHVLVHWRYHLYEWVIDYLQNKGIFSNEKILEREHWSMKRRRKYANDTVDMMDTSGEIDRLYKDFDLNIKNAKGLKVGFPFYPRFLIPSRRLTRICSGVSVVTFSYFSCILNSPSLTPIIFPSVVLLRMIC